MDNKEEIEKAYMKNYQKDFGIQISEKEAKNSLYNLIGYMKTLEKIHKRIELDKRLKSKKFLKKFKSDNIEMDTTSS
ncbi:hypothetical protein H6762_03835 [Candidatus Nomurabacteria bacterium]|nr:hypothetical protein [Candidatus Nomurabacteria bacterium]